MDPVVAVVTVILSGGFVAALIAAFKATPERESISVETLRGVIKELRTEATRLREVINQLEAELGRKEDQIAAQDRQIAEQRAQINELLAAAR